MDTTLPSCSFFHLGKSARKVSQILPYESTLLWVSPESNSEIRIQFQVVYLGSDVRKYQLGSEGVISRREDSQQRVSYQSSYH